MNRVKDIFTALLFIGIIAIFIWAFFRSHENSKSSSTADDTSSKDECIYSYDDIYDEAYKEGYDIGYYDGYEKGVSIEDEDHQEYAHGYIDGYSDCSNGYESVY